MEKFAKIIETSARQILVTKQWNEEEERPEIRIETSITNARASVNIGFSNEADRDEAFEKSDDHYAKAVDKLFEGLL